MKKQPVLMMNRLGTGHIITIFVYWIVSYMVLPSIRPFAVHGLWEDLKALSWIDMFCYALNAFTTAVIMKEHLSDAFFEVRYCPRTIIETVSTAVMLMLLWVAVISIGAYCLLGELLIMIDYVPVSEMAMTMTPGLLVETRPLIGTLCFTCLVPFTVCGFFYATGFAPLCCSRPWLAYLNTAFLLLIAAGIQAFWYKDTVIPMISYFLQLPIHLTACWSYQRTDNIWAPVFSIGLLNLLSSVLFLVLCALG